MDRFLIRDFFVLCREELCRDFGIRSGKVVFAKMESGAHDSSSVKRYSTAAASGDLSYQAVCMEAAEDSTHFGAGLLTILTEETQMLGRFKLSPDIAIPETSQAMLSIHDRLK